MSQSNLSVQDTLPPGANGFLAAVNANAGTGGLSGLFQDLLNATQILLPPTGSPNAASHAASVQPNTDNNATKASSPSGPTIGDIIGALKDFSAKWQSAQSHASNPSPASAPNAGTKTSTPPCTPASPSAGGTGGASQTAPATNTATASDTPATTVSEPSDDSATTGNDSQPSWSDLIAELQSIMQMLQQNLPAPSSTTTASAGTATTPTDSDSVTAPQELLNAGTALGDLLGLMQKLEKKFDPASSNADANATPVAGTNDTADIGSDLLQAPADDTIDPLAALDDRLKNDIKVLVEALKSATNSYVNAHAVKPNAVASISRTAQATTESADTVSADLNATAASSAPASQPVAAKDILQATINVANDAAKQIDNLYPTATPSNAGAALLTANAVATSDRGTNFNTNEENTPNGNTTAGISPQLQGAASSENTKSANPYSFASQLSAARAQNGGTTGLPSAVEQVLLQLNRNAKSGNDQMSLQLHPADLGTINIKLDFASNGTVTGTVTANNADTLAMLQKDSRSLERALQEAGLRADPGSLQFSLGQQSNPNQTGQNGFNQSASGSANSSDTSDSLASLAIDAPATAESWVVTPGRVNIQV